MAGEVLPIPGKQYLPGKREHFGMPGPRTGQSGSGTDPYKPKSAIYGSSAGWLIFVAGPDTGFQTRFSIDGRSLGTGLLNLQC
jgi:hypothetical protein